MHFHIMTLFPEMVLEGLRTSIIGRAEEKGCISIDAVNIRDYTLDRHKKVDDYTYGGGAGMLMQAQPVYDCWKALDGEIAARKKKQSGNEIPENAKKARVIYVTPQGKVFNQKMAVDLAKEEDLIFLCGHYEGIDERVLEEIVTDYISIGDYVLTGGELPAMVIIDAVSRLVPGVLSNDESAQTESHANGLLEYPQYSRPEVWHEKKVPDVLLSGHHANIEKWRMEQSINRTRERRPELYEEYMRAHPPKPPKKRKQIINGAENSDRTEGCTVTSD
ncbi:MAG: tRNA (guanosine(37)-N1)-methyltransferase TrmD [Lachnospiraceae bacterium]|nr:tRNA (guanosine(37)-N1)-methyltransferase TrmD [Lachnospiraceae bacterium]